MISYLMICSRCRHVWSEQGQPATFCNKCGERLGVGQSQSAICDAIALIAQALGCNLVPGPAGGQPGQGGNTCDKVPTRDQAIQSDSALQYLSGIWFGGAKSFQGFDCITLQIDPSLAARGIGGFNDPDNRVLALNSDSLSAKILGTIDNWRIMEIEAHELMNRHTENDVQKGQPSLGRTYIVAEKGHREGFFNPAALPQAGA